MNYKEIWVAALGHLKETLPQHAIDAWFEPIKAIGISEDKVLLEVPNQFFCEWIDSHYKKELVRSISFGDNSLGGYRFSIGAVSKEFEESSLVFKEKKKTIVHQNNLNRQYSFENFIEGSNNEFAKNAGKSVSEEPGENNFNPLTIYGGVGLGKTHLMHAVGNEILNREPKKRIVYVHSEKFVSDMVKALQLGAMNEFKSFYRNADALLIDDIQFFAGKEQSQEEFFHTFNALLDRNNQMILTCDKYPKEIDGLEDRLKSRLGWGLPVVIDPPELETRAAVLLSKASSMGVVVPNDCAIYIAQRIRSNIRELEGALKRVVANARFTNQDIDLALVKEALKDLFVISAKMVSIENIQKTTAEYYNIKLSDLLSKRRSRSITRPRQMAMALTKELTNHSLPEIGEAFNGRDHTTVLHACKKITELRKENPSHEEDYRNLNRALTN